MKFSNNLENKGPLDTYWRVKLICKNVQAHSSLEPQANLYFLLKALKNNGRSDCSVFSFCKMAGEQSIMLFASELEGRGAWIAHKFLTCFYCRIILSLGVLSKPWMINLGTRTDIYERKTAKQV